MTPSLPQSVYDQWADAAVRVVNMPQGTFSIPGDKPLRLHRSNVTVNFAGCTLRVNPSDVLGGQYPIQIASETRTTPTYPGGPGWRYLSKLRGAIGKTTKTLTMDERVPLTAGEQVLIHAGVSASDPVEAQDFIVATVASVNAKGVVTFTAPLAKAITNYQNAAGLRAVVAPGQENKIGSWGTWPDDSNFSKGFGTKHGLERFGGGMVHDVTLNDLHMVLDHPTSADRVPNTMWDLSAVAVRNLTINRLTLENPCGSGVQLWRCFNTAVNDYQVSGAGSAKIWNVSTIAAQAVNIWGGEGFSFLDLSIHGTDIVAFSTEIGPRSISVEGVDYSVEFTDARDDTTPPVVFGFFSVQGAPKLTDVSLHAVTVGGSAHEYFSYAPIESRGWLCIPSLTATLDFGYQRPLALLGTVTIGGITYGPPVKRTLKVTLLPSQPRVSVPVGLYTAAKVQLTKRGATQEVWDSFGHRYTDKALTGQPFVLEPDKWHQIEAGTESLARYLAKDLEFDQRPTDSPVKGQAVLTLTYLPAQA